jgi:hypothetical protein
MKAVPCWIVAGVFLFCGACSQPSNPGETTPDKQAKNGQTNQTLALTAKQKQAAEDAVKALGKIEAAVEVTVILRERLQLVVTCCLAFAYGESFVIVQRV